MNRLSMWHFKIIAIVVGERGFRLEEYGFGIRGNEKKKKSSFSPRRRAMKNI